MAIYFPPGLTGLSHTVSVSAFQSTSCQKVKMHSGLPLAYTKLKTVVFLIYGIQPSACKTSAVPSKLWLPSLLKASNLFHIV